MSRSEAITDLFQSADKEGRDQLTPNEIVRLLGYEEDIQPATGTPATGISIGIRCLRDFGMVIEAGIGGEDEEIYTGALRRGQAGVTAAIGLIDAEGFLELFRTTAAYRRLARTAGDRVPALDTALEACIRQLLQIADNFSPEHPDTPWIIEELVLNPVMFDGERLLPGDCRCRFARPASPRAARPIEKIDNLLHPRSIGIIGVSASKMNFGRIILNNIVGFDLETGLPPPKDYRDHPYMWRSGFYKLDRKKLEKRLRRSELVIGDVKETIPWFLKRKRPPIGFIAFDLDFYSSTKVSFKIFDHKNILPRAYLYFDDTIGKEDELYNEFAGVLLAIKEYNEKNKTRKIAQINGFRFTRVVESVWNEKMYVHHSFKNKHYSTYIFPDTDRQNELT